jgi:hypothetical protein
MKTGKDCRNKKLMTLKFFKKYNAMKKNQAITLTLLFVCTLFTSNQMHAQWSQNSTSIWNSNLNANVGIGTSTPTSAKLQFANVAGNKICLFSDNATQGSGFGINNYNLVAYIPDFPNQRFSVRLNSYTGAEKFIVNREGTVATGSRIFVGQLGTENGGYSLIHFKNGTSVTGGVVRASVGSSDAGDAPLGLQASTLSFVNSGGFRFYINTAGNVGIGTTNPTYKLSVNGSIQAKEIRVETGWADFVFAPEYALRPLSEVESYICQNRHLPDVTPASEIQKDGLQVGKQMTEMMQKIEELTLYLIDLKKENTNIQQENAALKTRIEKLEKK